MPSDREVPIKAPLPPPSLCLYCSKLQSLNFQDFLFICVPELPQYHVYPSLFFSLYLPSIFSMYTLKSISLSLSLYFSLLSLALSIALYLTQGLFMLQIRKNPLDLNNLPEDYSERWREGKQVFEETTSEGGDNTSMDDKTKEKKDEGRKRKCCANEGKEGCGKVYECRFCSLKFCKSQALGGHMNRHRQERETETLNRARQLVYSNENMVVPGLNIGLRDQNLAGAPAIPTGNFHQRTGVEVPLPYPSIFTRPPSPGSPAIFSQSQPYLYHHPSASRLLPFPAQFTQQPDYLIGHVLPGNSHYNHHPNPPNYWKTIDGEPNSGGFANNPAAGEAAPYNQVEGGGAGWVSFQEDQQGQVPATMQQRFQDNF